MYTRLSQICTSGSRRFSVKASSEQLALGSLPSTADSTVRRSQSAPFHPTLHSAAAAISPWLLLAFVFFIPGVYLEWPSDSWEHFRRITEWATHDLVGGHSAGYKSLYFFAYSFVGGISSGRQLF